MIDLSAIFTVVIHIHPDFTDAGVETYEEYVQSCVGAFDVTFDVFMVDCVLGRHVQVWGTEEALRHLLEVHDPQRLDQASQILPLAV